MEEKLDRAIRALFNYLYSDFQDLEKWAKLFGIELPEPISERPNRFGKMARSYQIFGYLVAHDGGSNWQILNLYKSKSGSDLSRLELGGKFS